MLLYAAENEGSREFIDIVCLCSWFQGKCGLGKSQSVFPLSETSYCLGRENIPLAVLSPSCFLVMVPRHCSHLSDNVMSQLLIYKSTYVHIYSTSISMCRRKLGLVLTCVHSVVCVFFMIPFECIGLY